MKQELATFMKIGPNEPCHCGSGRKYKHCHRPIDEAPPEDRYQAGHARNWSLTATEHYNNQRYHWMANILVPYQPKRVFDVGCGSGHALLALFEVLGASFRSFQRTKTLPAWTQRGRPSAARRYLPTSSSGSARG